VVSLGGSLGLRQLSWMYYNCFYGSLWVVITFSRLESLLKASPNKVFLSKLSLSNESIIRTIFQGESSKNILRGDFQKGYNCLERILRGGVVVYMRQLFKNKFPVNEVNFS
jgi:hypothetical protein